MRNFILDTNILIAYLKANPLFTKVSEDNNLNDEDAFIMISSISKGELLSLAMQNNWGERRVNILNKLLSEVVIIDVAGNDDNLLNAPTLHSHTHCQAAPANAQTQAWQRVCLSNRTTKTTDKPTDEKNTEAITAVLQKANPPKELKTTKTENTENKNETDKKTTKAIVVDPKTLLADAKKLANNDKKILELITATNKTISATRGRTFGPAYCERKVYSNSTCTDYILFEGGSKAEVAISGDGDNDLDLYVYDENNNLIAKDDDYTDRCYVSFYPKWEGSFKIVVKNRGSRVYSNYILRSN
jgi:hypothetical protein